MTHQPGVYVPLRALFLVFFKLFVLLLNLYFCLFFLLLKYLFELKGGCGMMFIVLKYYVIQENGTVEMVLLVSHHH